MSYLNSLLEKPLCYLKHVLRAFWCFFITLGRNAVILTFDYLWWFASAVAFLQAMFSFFGLKGFSPVCAAPVPRCVRSNPWQHAGPGHKRDGRGAHPAGDTALGPCGPARSLSSCQEPLSLPGLRSLAAMQPMKVLWTSPWFTACGVFRLVHHRAYFVPAGFADINNDTMRSALNSSAYPSSKEFVFPQ